MPRHIDREKILQRYRTMLEYQSRIYHFSPTIRELMDLWQLKTTSAVHHTLSRMQDDNLLFVRDMGDRTYYHAKPLSLTNIGG